MLKEEAYVSVASVTRTYGKYICMACELIETDSTIHTLQADAWGFSLNSDVCYIQNDPSSKKKYYAVFERDFNIWYLPKSA